MGNELFILEEQDTDNVTTDRGPTLREEFGRAIDAYPWHRDADVAQRNQMCSPTLCVHDLRSDRGLFLSCYRTAKGEYRYTVANLIPALRRRFLLFRRAGRLIDLHTIAETHPGSFFENMLAFHPFLPKTSRLVLADYVTMDSGTGCVHTAPGFGADDYVTCKIGRASCRERV